MAMTRKELNRAITRGIWPADKSAAYEIRNNPDAQWRREWIKRGLGRTLHGPKAPLP